MAAESVDVRLARLEGSYAQVSERLGTIEQRLSGMEARLEQRFISLEGILEQRFARVEGRIDRLEMKVDRQFTWIVGLIVISFLIPIALRFLPAP